MPDAASPPPLSALQQPGTIRARCAAILKAVDDNVSAHFTIDRSQLEAVTDRVAVLARRRFPDLDIPLHSRWRHFEAGGVDRKAELDARLAGRSEADTARARFDLTVLSVLLDAGAGPQWRYDEVEGIDPIALPLQQRGGAELLELLDRVAAGRPRAPAAARGGDDDASDDGGDAAAQERPAPPDPAPATGPGAAGTYTRSEGLAVASLRAFAAGAFSATAGDPLRADAAALRLVDATALRAMFQSTPAHPLLGIEGRVGLVNRLGDAVAAEAARSGLPPRPGLLFDLLTDGGSKREVGAAQVLTAVLRVLAPVWRSGSTVQGVAAGDVWPHRWAGAATGDGRQDPGTAGWVPFHKLSQWLAYSLVEPLRWAGVAVTGLDALTGLPEYRNGGLLLDAGVIVPRHPRALERRYGPGDEFVVEWRALTVMLLDELAGLVRARLGRSAEQMPLACVLEGGTWAAGREIAAERRAGSAPPLQIDSDGTVF